MVHEKFRLATDHSGWRLMKSATLRGERSQIERRAEVVPEGMEMFSMEITTEDW